MNTNQPGPILVIGARRGLGAATAAAVATDLGAAAIAGYAEIAGQSRGDALARPPLFTLDHAGRCLAKLVSHPDVYTEGDYLLDEDGLVAV